MFPIGRELDAKIIIITASTRRHTRASSGARGGRSLRSGPRTACTDPMTIRRCKMGGRSTELIVVAGTLSTCTEIVAGKYCAFQVQ